MSDEAKRIHLLMRQFIVFCAVLVLSGTIQASPSLFGYQETPQSDIQAFTQWIDVLERHIVEDIPDPDCTSERFSRCDLNEWKAFIEEIRPLSRQEQLQAVNQFANKKRYILDIDNYGTEDYWAVAREFLGNGGDCEDYAITKLFSLLWLGFPVDKMRIVVLQDTNLRIPHAILAYYADGNIYLLDNQIQEVIDHRSIVHYVPVYSINEQGWWIHTPSS